MANPQLEDGYVKIANEIVEALARKSPGFAESQVLMVIIRKTYGWHKTKDRISIKQIQDATGISRRRAIYAIQNLEAKKMIVVEREKTEENVNLVNTIKLNKNHEEWVVQEISEQYRKCLENRKEHYKNKKMGVVQEEGGSASNVNEVVQESENDKPILAPTKETITKETITKETTQKKNSVDEIIEIYNRTRKYMPAIIPPLHPERVRKVKVCAAQNTFSLKKFEQAVGIADNIFHYRPDKTWLGFNFMFREKGARIDALISGDYDYLIKDRETQECKFVYDATDYITARKCTEPAVKFGYCTKHMGS